MNVTLVDKTYDKIGIIFYFYFLELVYCPRGQSPLINITILYVIPKAPLPFHPPGASWTARPRRPPPKTQRETSCLQARPFCGGGGYDVK